ncbi:protein BANP-like [Mytilus trossulus]|uniref:protein BANP-like n=1 Tax=Mytilus trossulus TaxID=6551 RepID=UPI003005FCCA
MEILSRGSTSKMSDTNNDDDMNSDQSGLNVQTLPINTLSVLPQSYSDDSGLIINDPSTDEGPPAKRIKIESHDHLSQDQSIKQLLFTINKAICMRLDGIENSIEILNGRTKYLEERMDELVDNVKSVNGTSASQISPNPSKKGAGAVIVGLPQNGGQTAQNVDVMQNMGLGPNVTLITLNSEDDFPNGTWLGDESNPEMRVRVPITPSDILHVHSNCRTAEKMALTMLDYLFDRETQASSNLSGMGKHGKKQLDPLMIYGIRCHLIHRFGIAEADWHRIKQNMDSKCRTAFRRKQRGMPLTVKAFRGKSVPNFIGPGGTSDLSISDDDSLQDSELHIHQGDQGELKQTLTMHNIDSSIKQALSMHGDGLPQGEIQILHATPEQISQLQQAQHIQILQGDQIIQLPLPISQADGTEGLQVVNSVGDHSDSLQVHTVTTDSGEVLHIQQTDHATE